MKKRIKLMSIALCVLLIAPVFSGIIDRVSTIFGDNLEKTRPEIKFGNVVWQEGFSWPFAPPIIERGGNCDLTFTILNTGNAPACDIKIEAEILYSEGCTFQRNGKSICTVEIEDIIDPGEKSNPIELKIIVDQDARRKGFRVISLVAEYYKDYGYGPIPIHDYDGPYYSYAGRITNYFFVEECDWKAKALKPSYCIRRNYTLDGKVRKAHLCVVTEYNYTLFINGKYVDSTSLGKGIAEGRSYIFPIDITNYLEEGENAIGVSTGEISESLLVEGSILLENGTFMRILSDENWKCSCWKCDSDPKKEQNWAKPGFNDDNWANAEAHGNIHQECGIIEFFANWEDARDYRFPPYFGPIDLGPIDAYGDAQKPPIFDLDEGITLEIKIPATLKGELKYCLVNAFTDKKEDEGTLQLNNKEDNSYHCSYTYSPDKSGVWNLYLELKPKDIPDEGEQTYERYLEVVVVGEIEQKEVAGSFFTEGMDLEEVTTIECSDPLDPHPFMEGGGDNPSEIINGYRETDQKWQSWFSYAFKVENLSVPHLVEVEYPDDKERGILVRIGEISPSEPTESYTRAAFGIYTGGEEYPNTYTTQRMYAIYWPNSHLATVEIFNMQGKPTKAAASKIIIYEITNDLPAIKINNAQERLVGQFTEREPLTRINFYQGEAVKDFMDPVAWDWGRCFRHDHPGFYKEWYITTANLIKYMRFSGQNLYMPSIDSYSRPYYTSEIPGRSDGFTTKDHIDLMAKMFEKNNLSLILGLQFVGTRRIWDMDTDENVRTGGSTIRVVTKNGEKVYASNIDGGFNYFHPDVEKEFMKVIEDIVGRYKDYPAFKGIYFHGAGWCAPGLSLFGSEGISGDFGWQQESYDISLGEHEIKWEYSKDREKKWDQDMGCIDDVEFVFFDGFEDGNIDKWNDGDSGWQIDGDEEWKVVVETDIRPAHTGNYSAMCTSGYAEQRGRITRKVGCPGTLKFWWKAESNPAGDSYLSFCIDGEEVERINTADWNMITVDISPEKYKIGEEHTIEWEFYSGTDSGGYGQIREQYRGCGQIDDVEFVFFDGFEDGTMDMRIEDYTIYSGWNRDGASDRYPKWDVVEGGAYSGSFKACSGSICDNQRTSINRLVEGPGTLTFYWKVSSEYYHDYLRFCIDDAQLWSALDRGYGDETWKQFREEIKPYPVSIPDWGTDVPDRFKRRYDWTNESEDNKKLWINWRCTRTQEQIEEILGILTSARSDLKLFINFCGPAPFELEEWLDDYSVSYNDMLRRSGIDLSDYKESENIIVIRSWCETPEKRDTNENRIAERLRASQEVVEIMDPEALGQSFKRFAEWGMVIDRNWAWKSTSRFFSGLTPAERYFAQEYVRSLKLAVPSLIYFYKVDCNILTGSEQGLRHVAQAYRTLRPGRYELVAGSNFEETIPIMKLDIEDERYFYMTNLNAKDVMAVITLDGSAIVTDLVSNKRMNIEESFTIHFKPYDLRSFKISPKTDIVSAEIISTNMVVDVKTDKEAYHIGEPVEVIITVTNYGPDTTLYFKTEQMADFKITTGIGEDVYLWSHDRIFPEYSKIVIGQGETIELLSDTWNWFSDDGTSVFPGRYYIDGWMVETYKDAEIKKIYYPEIHGELVGITGMEVIDEIDPSNLVAAYNFDEGKESIGLSGQNYWPIYDVSAHANDGIAKSTGTFDWVSGISGSAIYFSDDDWVEIPDSTSLRMTNAITVEAWVKNDNISDPWSRIVTKGIHFTDQYYGWLLDFQDVKEGKTAVNFYVEINGTQYSSGHSGYIIEQSKWYHIVGTFDGEYIRIYVNGEEKNKSRHPGKMTETGGPFDVFIGKSHGWEEYLTGAVDQVGIYNRVLDIDEIKEHYIRYAGEKQFLTGIFSTFNLRYDVVELGIRANKEVYSGKIYGIEISPYIQQPRWEGIEVFETPEGWNLEKIGNGVRFYTQTNPLLVGQYMKFRFRVKASQISWYMRIHVTDKYHENLGMIISRRRWLYYCYLV
jgi:hypothetical protein